MCRKINTQIYELFRFAIDSHHLAGQNWERREFRSCVSGVSIQSAIRTLKKKGL